MILAELQERAKLGGKRPSDAVEGLQFDVRWEPQSMALGIPIPPVATSVEEGELVIVRDPNPLQRVLL